jgi:hypothetical protein
MTKHLTTLALCASLFAPGCDDVDDPEVARMIELCDGLDDCDPVIDAYLDSVDPVDHAQPPRDFTTRPSCSHGCGDPPRDLVAPDDDWDGEDTGDGRRVDDLAQPGIVPDPDPAPHLPI